MSRFPRTWILCGAASLICASVVVFANSRGILQRFPLTADSMTQWRLPDRLNELSGLALTRDGRLLTVTDESAIVYELDFQSGRLVKAFAFGNPVVKGDFEGIAVVDDLVYLVTSAGRIYIAAEGADGQRVTFDNYDTELGNLCEIEGLTRSENNSRLYILCKNVRKNSQIKNLMIFAWSVEDRELLVDESLSLPESAIRKKLRVDRLSPSGLTIDRNSGNFVVIAARQRALIEISRDGRLVDARNLTLTTRHRQAEGIELTTNGKLLIADEGGTHKARLAVYRQDEDESNIDE